MAGAREILELVIKGDAKGAIEAFRGTEKAADGAEGAVTRSGAMFEKLTGRFPALGKAAEKFGIDAGNAGTVAAGAATAAATAAAAFAAKSVEAYQNVAGEILKFQRASGASAEEASKFVEVAGDYGVSADQAAGSVGKLAKAVSTTPGAFKEYGIEIAKNADGTTDLVGTLVNAAGAFDRIQDPAKRAEMGTKLFGKSWQDMLPLLEKGSDGLRESFEGVSKLKILNEKDLKQAEEFRLAMDDLKDAGEGLMIQVGRGLVPVISDLATELGKVTGAADKLTGPVGGLGKLFGGIVQGAKDGSFALGGFKAGMQGAAEKAAEAAEKEKALAEATKYAGSQADLYVKSLVQRNEAGAQGVRTAEEQAEADEKLAKQTAALEKANEEAAKAAADHATALDRLMDASTSLYLSQIDLDEAVLHFNDTLIEAQQKANEATEARKRYKEGSDQIAKADRDAADSLRSLQREMVGVAEKAVKAAADKKAAAGDGELTLLERYSAQKKALEDLAVQYPAAKGAIDQYMSQALDPLIAKSGLVRDVGVRAAQSLIDAFRNANGQITQTADNLDRRTGGTSAGGSGGRAPTLSSYGGAAASVTVPASVTINVTSLDPQAAGRLVVDAIASYERTNGTGWRS